MTNYEHYKEQIEKIARLGWRVAVDKNNKPHACNEMNCNDCIVDNGNCYQTVFKWADEEYIEPTQQVGWPKVDWTKVPVDTPIFVRDGEGEFWLKRHFRNYEEGYVYAFNDGHTSWTADGRYRAWNFAKLAEGELNGEEKE